LTTRPTRMSAKSLAGFGVAAGVLGMPAGLATHQAGWLLAAGAILLGIAAILRDDEERQEEERFVEGAGAKPPLTARAAIVCGALALAATVYSAATGSTLVRMILG
jgi:hypothetical protein